jgi:hypothetical protein
MSAVMELRSARIPQFHTVTSSSTTELQTIVWQDSPADGGLKINEAHRAAILEAVSLLSSDLDRMSTLSATRVDHTSAHMGFMHTLRIYTGCALVGAVTCGVALGWLGHRELIQVVGALAGITLYAILSRRKQSLATT